MQNDQEEVVTWAIVRSVTSDGQITVEVIDDSACHTSSCGAAGLGCRTNAFAHLLKRAPALSLHLPTHVLSCGDRVQLALPQQALIRASLLAYLLPMIMLIIGMVIGQQLAGDWAAFFWGMLALLSTWYWVGKLAIDCTPRILQVQSIVE